MIAHRFCCPHSRPPQGRGSVRGEPLTGSPTRVQSPARRRPLLRSKSAAPKKKDTHAGVFLFCDCPQLLLFALPHTARKGECEGGTLDGFPHSRSITRPQATTFAQQKCRSQKRKTPTWVSFFFWSGRRGSNSLPRPWQGRALPDELRPQTAPLLRHLGASGRSRTNDTRIFSPLLYQLSYRGIWRPRRGSNPRPPA